jgi:hypothetical protein
MVELNNGSISTYILSGLALISAAIVADPTLLGPFGEYAQYILPIATLFGILYNGLFKRPDNNSYKQGYVDGFNSVTSDDVKLGVEDIPNIDE